MCDTIEFWIATKRNAVIKMIKSVDAVVINDEEAKLLTKEDNLIKCAKKMMSWGASYVVIKKGEHGAILFHEDGSFAIPAYPVTELRDPTGAGDSFAGALIGRLASRNRTDFSAIKEAILYGTCVASLTVESFGCDRLESAGSSEIEKRVEDLRKLISVD